MRERSGSDTIGPMPQAAPKLYLVSYDLDEPGPRDYSRIEKRLHEFQAMRVLLSQWLLWHPLPIAALEHDFMQYIDPSTDRLLIVQINPGEIAWNKLLVDDKLVRIKLAT